MPEPTIGLTIRMPPTVHEAMLALAKANRRSLTGEIIFRLEEAIRIDAPATRLEPHAMRERDRHRVGA